MRKLLSKLSHEPVAVALVIGLPFLRSAIRKRELKLPTGTPNMAAWQVVLFFYAVIIALNLLVSF